MKTVTQKDVCTATFIDAFFIIVKKNVHPDYRKNGIASNLIGELISTLMEQGSHSLMLEVRESNEPAKLLYLKLGFEVVGVRKNYYRNPKENALILRKEWDL